MTDQGCHNCLHLLQERQENWVDYGDGILRPQDDIIYGCAKGHYSKPVEEPVPGSCPDWRTYAD